MVQSKISTQDILNLFRYFAVTYMAKWTSPIEGMESQALEVWYRELSGLSQDQLARGLEQCRHEEWPPSLPQFRLWCVDVPGLEDMTHLVFRGSSHPVAEVLRRRIGGWNLRHNTEEENRRRIRGMYRDVVEDYVEEAASLPSISVGGEEKLAIAGDMQDAISVLAGNMRIGGGK